MSENETFIGVVKYRFSILPKWARAMYWSTVLTVIMLAVVIGVILAIHLFTTTFGWGGFIAFCFIAMLFVCAYITVWYDLSDDQEKAKRGEE